uniref:Secondary ossification center associated regulator of chondrocyte maturation n=1 Tax=Meleagris gallopavo TaxID=9103 RepID=G1MSG6_MELGA
EVLCPALRAAVISPGAVSLTAAAPLPAEHPRGPLPTLWNEPAELPSGSGPFDATTTARLSDATAFAPYTSELEPEDTTHLHRLDAGDGSLGPGAIGAIVIASLLGTSVLVALVVITLRKFSAS